MEPITTSELQTKAPTRFGAAVFRAKSVLLQARRFGADQLSRSPRRFQRSDELNSGPLLAESRTALWTETAAEERSLVAGKIQNLRLAAKLLDGIVVPGGEIFSFWKHVGRTSRMRGFVEGRELREGCIIPNVGGGLCQLSNALYDAALKGHFEIIERHAHTRVIPGSLAEQGRDATVFWNYVDLRFRSQKAFRIEIELDAAELTVRLRGERSSEPKLHTIRRKTAAAAEPNSCATCGVESCHRVLPSGSKEEFGRAAFLVDEYWPEFDGFIQAERKANDSIFLPIDGAALGKPNYAWTTSGFSEVSQRRLLTALRSVRSRRLAAQGAARQKNLIETYRSLAASFANGLSYDTLHIVVQQNLLPFLWETGELRGRTFDVLMTAVPMAELQRRLDVAKALHPESTTLGDFRADPSLVETETLALDHASRIVTPHTEIAGLFPEKAVLLEWQRAGRRDKKAASGGNTILFPASTVGRKGCYELRDAIRGLDVRLQIMGPEIENSGFWNGFNVERVGPEALEAANVVVLPAFVEHRPRRLILAVANGIPVIASSACGLGSIEGVTTIVTGDPGSLRSSIIDKISAG